MDSTLGGQWPENEILKCILIGLLCVQEAAADRSTTSQIVMMLNAAPPRPGFYVSKANPRSVSRTEDSDSTQLSMSSQPSINGVSITEFDPL